MTDEREVTPAPDISAMARALASRPRRKQERVCVVCGRTFEGNAKAKYCSRACAAKAFREQHKGAASVREGGRSVADPPS